MGLYIIYRYCIYYGIMRGLMLQVLQVGADSGRTMLWDHLMVYIILYFGIYYRYIYYGIMRAHARGKPY